MPAPYIILPLTTLPLVEQPLRVSDFLGVFDRVLGDDYLAPLKSPGPGYEILQAFAASDARVSQGTVNSLNVYILSSQGGQLAQGFVAITRPTALAGAVVVNAGTLVTTSIGTRSFFTTSNAYFGASDLVAHTDPAHPTQSQSIPIVAVAQGWDWNRQGQVNAANGDVLSGDIDTFLLLIETPPFGDPSVQVTNVEPILGGRAPVLDQIGLDMNLPRFQNETDTAYAARLRTLPDTISPLAVQRTINKILGPYPGLHAIVQEPLGPGALPPVAGFGGMIVGFFDADPPPPRPTVPLWGPAFGSFLPVPLLGGIAGPGPYGGTLYAAGSSVTQDPPVVGPNYRFDLTSGAGSVSGSTQPNFAGTAPGGTVSDGGLVWTNSGVVIQDAVTPGAIGLWYMDQNVATGVPGPGLNQRVPPGYTASVGLIGPSDESEATSRAFFRILLPYVENVNPGLGFAFFDVAPYPPQGFFDGSSIVAGNTANAASFSDGTVRPTDVVAGQIFGALQPVVLAGVNFEIVVVSPT